MSLAVETELIGSPPLLSAQPPHTPDDVIELEEEGLFELVTGRLVEKKMSALSNKSAGEIAYALIGWTRRTNGRSSFRSVIGSV